MRELTRHLTLTRGAFAGTAIWAVTSVMAAQTQPQPQTVWSSIYSEAQAYRGEKVADTLCIGCHGAGLTGGDSGPKLVGERFLTYWSGKSVAELFDWIQKEMPEDAPGTLSKQDATAVLAYILQVNKMPTGKQDLPGERDGLARIQIVAVKP